MIKTYSCIVKGGQEGDMGSSYFNKGIETFILGEATSIKSSYPDSGSISVGHMDTGKFSKGVTIIRFLSNEDKRNLPAAEKKSRLYFYLIGTKKACRRARRKLEKLIGLVLEDEGNFFGRQK